MTPDQLSSHLLTMLESERRRTIQWRDREGEDGLLHAMRTIAAGIKLGKLARAETAIADACGERLAGGDDADFVRRLDEIADGLLM